jgi:hypothetical protein
MTATFESILPIFLLILVGNMLRRAPVFDDATWPSALLVRLERLDDHLPGRRAAWRPTAMNG